MVTSRGLLALSLSLVFGLLAGCARSSGPPEPPGAKGQVTGKVTYNGAPVTTGSLSLDSGKGFVLGAYIKPDGTYELAGSNGKQVPAGTYAVAVIPPSNPPPAAGATSMPPPPKIEGLPSKFYETGTSGVTVEIKEGKQELNIDLK